MSVRLPSVLLHDHLDGGLRVATILELADEQGYDALPTTDADGLAAWFDQASSGSLEGYLGAFDHTIALMQDGDSLERVAYEAAVDLAADGVVYAEVRLRPNHHVKGGLEGADVIDAVAAGLRMGAAETGLVWRIIVDALRQYEDSLDTVRLAVAKRNAGVVGFDLAGPEEGFPPTDHLDACRLARVSGLRLTIHAGESGRTHGVAYMASAMDVCGGERLGHGVELIYDCVVADGEIVDMGAVASRILDRQIPLEMCPHSNMATSGWAAGQHPIGPMYRAGFNVTISTDNRLMSNTSMSNELGFVTQHHGFDMTDLAITAKRSLAAAFCDHETKVELWGGTIAPAYRHTGADIGENWLSA